MLAENVYYVGQLARLSLTVRNLAEQLIDPTALNLRVVKPDGAGTTYMLSGAQITRASLGTFFRDVDLDQGGRWRYRWWSTGTGQGAKERSFLVRELTVV